VLQNTARQILTKGYQVLKLTDFVPGGIDAYNDALAAEDAEENKQEVREEQGHEQIVGFAQLCALADAAAAELHACMDNMKDCADRNKLGEISAGTMKGILYYDRNLADEVAGAWEYGFKDPKPSQISGKALEERYGLMKVALGRHATVEKAQESLIADIKSIGEKYEKVLKDIISEAEDAAEAALKKEPDGTFEGLYLRYKSRDEQGRDLEAMKRRLEGGIDRFQAKAAAAANWNLEWVGATVAEMQSSHDMVAKLLGEMPDAVANPA
jgi:hypothetical protein